MSGDQGKDLPVARRLVVEGRETVTVAEGGVPVLCIDEGRHTSTVAMAVNFLRSGCLAVQLVLTVDSGLAGGPSKYLVDKVGQVRSILSALGRPREEAFEVDTERDRAYLSKNPDFKGDFVAVISVTRKVAQ